MSQHVAIAGATGAVGTEFLKLLEARDFPMKSLRLLASSRSAGSKLKFRGENLEVEELTPKSFKGIDIAFFSAGGSRSKEFAPHAVDSGAVVIDNSSAFRMDEKVPLVVPEINPKQAFEHQGLIANPNCSTIQMVVALNPIHRAANIQRVVVSTYQAVSGAGASAMEELKQQLRAWANDEPMKQEVFPTQIAFNLFPHIDVFQDNGYTKEEMKMVHETRKIMNAPNMQISATCVRVPVLRAHSEAVWVETEKPLSESEARELFEKEPGIVVQDERESGGYPTPWHITETQETYVGRIRKDISHPNGLTFWVVADQLYKGAALNAIQIAEVLQQG
ncbi:MAG: aspartate-semialdehyde dehydrogenase [Deltaproteobacteria bacterium]|jgi:aspartate-semialdehyde dehydrogenase|nr:aspartate-semialdehyde dehydrogenase [SAR324 cluster bacterium]NBR18895.1 aspartate-semialdehyde dehydrogenase [Pseudomonadota bacterium]GIR31634.1 MAG: aspartate-semialdehyde dehydrogenase [Deltaproteobacteria bacterium]MEC7215675.1 aspartate-semialdehyde dehydrogenase [SAR324 cluster bacterium]MEC7467356.1 aspartate-semialdehyde dehydrogenase [SAR324 cluster bacterium]|tara:strand:- start:438 stop:1439 length:1002 start_codon:yes stop_codon:yes gene_type:complete